MPDRKIEVHGLRELRAALKAADGHSQAELRQANKDAAEIVARAARIRAPKGKHEGRPKGQPPLWASIKATSTAGRGYVAFGGAHAPHGPVIEFGGSIPRRGARASFGGAIKAAQAGHRAFSSFGLETTKIEQRAYVYPAIEAERAHVLHEYEEALKRLTRNL